MLNAFLGERLPAQALLFKMPSFHLHHSEQFSLKSPVMFVQILFMLIHDLFPTLADLTDLS